MRTRDQVRASAVPESGVCRRAECAGAGAAARAGGVRALDPPPLPPALLVNNTSEFKTAVCTEGSCGVPLEGCWPRPIVLRNPVEFRLEFGPP